MLSSLGPSWQAKFNKFSPGRAEDADRRQLLRRGAGDAAPSLGLPDRLTSAIRVAPQGRWVPRPAASSAEFPARLIVVVLTERKMEELLRPAHIVLEADGAHMVSRVK